MATHDTINGNGHPTRSGALRVAVIIGSVRADRFCPTPARWIAKQGDARDDIEADVIDLADHDLPTVMNGDDDTSVPHQVRELSERLDRADAFVVVTPVYNHGYPAVLKNAIDWFYDEWQAKPVGFVSYGGVGGGIFAVEQLRQVFSELHATTIRNTVSFADFWNTFGDDGSPTDPATYADVATAFFDQLAWWAHALREARAARPYAG